MTTTRWQGFFIKPSGEVEMLDPDGELVERWQETPSLYDDLVLAGYPASNDPSHMSDWIDLSIDPENPTSVTVYTAGAGEHEHDMGEASGLFLAWYAHRDDAHRA